MTAGAAAAGERILGVRFFTGTLADACARAVAGGLVVAPSGPGLAGDLTDEPAYRAALERADLVLTDSGFLVMLWRLRTGRRLPRHSGLAFLRAFLGAPVCGRSVFWVMPSEKEAERNRAWLRGLGLVVTPEDCHVAPHYGAGEIRDDLLRARIEARRPDIVMIAIGGGVQERLGLHLRETLSYRPGILCLGAAIAFLSGGQVAIPPWVDRWMLGWLWRMVSNPARFGPRYLRAMRLAWMVLRHGAEAPPPRGGG